MSQIYFSTIFTEMTKTLNLMWTQSKIYFCSCVQNLHIRKICVYANSGHVYRP